MLGSLTVYGLCWGRVLGIRPFITEPILFLTEWESDRTYSKRYKVSLNTSVVEKKKIIQRGKCAKNSVRNKDICKRSFSGT